MEAVFRARLANRPRPGSEIPGGRAWADAMDLQLFLFYPPFYGFCSVNCSLWTVLALTSETDLLNNHLNLPLGSKFRLEGDLLLFLKPA